MTSDGCSSLTDFACHCKQGAKLLSTVQPCVQGACSDEDEKTTIEAVQKTCAGAGVPIEIPGAASSAAPSSAAPKPTATTTPNTTVADPTKATPTASTTPNASGVASSWSYTTTVTPDTTIVDPTSALPTVHSSSKPSNGTVTTAKPSEFTGAAAQATQAAGLFGAAALALLAL